MQTAKFDRDVCCADPFDEARRLAELSHFEQHVGDAFQSLRQKQTPTRGRALTRIYPGSRLSSHPITMSQSYARSRTPMGSVGAELALGATREIGTSTRTKKCASSQRARLRRPPGH